MDLKHGTVEELLSILHDCNKGQTVWIPTERALYHKIVSQLEPVVNDKGQAEGDLLIMSDTHRQEVPFKPENKQAIRQILAEKASSIYKGEDDEPKPLSQDATE